MMIKEQSKDESLNAFVQFNCIICTVLYIQVS